MPDQSASISAIVDSRVLRRLAEAAAGIPAGESRFVRIVNGEPILVKDDSAGDAIFQTESHVSSAPNKAPFVVELGTGLVNGQPSKREVLDGCDAFFWSSAAIEKFVLPYYVPILGAIKAKELLDEYQSDGRMLGIAHGEYSEPTVKFEAKSVLAAHETKRTFIRVAMTDDTSGELVLGQLL